MPKIPIKANVIFLLQSMSVECGMNTGCVKIYKKADEYDEDGRFIPLHRRGPEIPLFRGNNVHRQSPPLPYAHFLGNR